MPSEKLEAERERESVLCATTLSQAQCWKAKVISWPPLRRKSMNPSIASEIPFPSSYADNRLVLVPANLSRSAQARPKQLLLPW